jgi:nonribosomal peptide synthetase DhbF
VAHAMATALQADGEQVALLGLLDGYPASGGQPPVSSADPEVLTLLLRSLGYDAGDTPMDYAEFQARVLAEGGPLATLDPDRVTALADTFAQNINLARNWTPQRFHGDVVFFRASADKTVDAPVPTDWESYVDGELTVHDIACQHGAMTQTVPLTTIGTVISEHLD